jgi:hypothetical protein
MKRTYDESVVADCLKRLKGHLRLTADDLDVELRAKLLAAVRSAENQIGTVIVRSSFTGSFDFSSSIYLGAPLIEVKSVEVDGVSLSKGFAVNKRAGTIVFDGTVSGVEVEVTYEAGLDQIPDDMMVAVLMIAASFFSNPMDSVQSLPNASANLLRPYRHYEVR